MTAVKPLLAARKLAIIVSDDLVLIGDRYYIKATVKIFSVSADFLPIGETDDATKPFNIKNESIESVGFAREEESKKGMDGSQITGAASSYARKYALNGLFAIDDAKDSDATNTGAAPTKPATPARVDNSNASWFDPKNASHQKIVIAAHEKTKQLGAPLVNNLRKIFKISKANAASLEKWTPKNNPPQNA